MLCRYDDRINAHGFATVIFDRHLRLAIRKQPCDLTALARQREPAAEPMGERDRQRHQLRRFIAGEADHHALVASADTIVSIHLLPGPDLDGVRHSAQDLRTLILDGNHDTTGVRVEPMERVGVTDLLDGVPYDRWNVDV